MNGAQHTILDLSVGQITRGSPFYKHSECPSDFKEGQTAFHMEAMQSQGMTPRDRVPDAIPFSKVFVPRTLQEALLE